MTISVVIPTLDEAERIVGAVESAFDRESGSSPEPAAAPDAAGGREARAAIGSIEVVVVDGGSRDATCRLAEEAGARVLAFPPAMGVASEDGASERAVRGRAHQLRYGSEKSKGEVLLFLHADTRLPRGWGAAVERALADPACAGGAFAFRFAERGGWERWIEFWTAVRVRIFGLPYGDQALFVRRSVLERMGGVPLVTIMEDLDLVRGIRSVGRLARLREAVTTSSRRYRARGPVRTILWHQIALLGWLLGWDRARLAARMGR